MYNLASQKLLRFRLKLTLTNSLIDGMGLRDNNFGLK